VNFPVTGADYDHRPKFRRLKSPIGDLMYFNYDRRLVIKILKVNITDWLPNVTALQKPPLTYQKWGAL